VGLRGGGGGGACGAGGWTGFAAFCGAAAGAFEDFATVGLDVFWTERRAVCPRLAPRAGFRAEVRVFLVTRRDLAIGIAIRPAFL